MTTRRQFFKLLAGAAALTQLPASAIAEIVPKVWCDGVHCDAAGLSALIRGEVVEFVYPKLTDGIGWQGGVLNLPGMFTLREPVILDETIDGAVLDGGIYVIKDGEGGFKSLYGSRATLANMHVVLDQWEGDRTKHKRIYGFCSEGPDRSTSFGVRNVRDRGVGA